MDIRLTHKGRTAGELLANGPGTLREISDRIAVHLGYPADLFWDTDGPLILDALTELVKTGPVSLTNNRYEFTN